MMFRYLNIKYRRLLGILLLPFLLSFFVTVHAQTNGDVWEFTTKQIPTNTSEIKESSTHDSKILVFPNLANDILYFRTDELLKTIEICSVMGAKLIYIKNPVNSINISTLSNGIYLFKTQLENGDFWVDRFIKK